MRRISLIIALIAAGELVFGLSFNLPRFFKPTMLDVLNLSNTQLSDMMAFYGVMAMISYFPGGVLADRFTARTLMTVSLFSTAAGGIYMATLPGTTGMTLLYGYWGVTTIFLFWGALIRATRDWGGAAEQGTAFGILEGGRGVAAALVSLIGILILALFLPEDADYATDEQRRAGFRAVIYFYSFVTFGVGVFTWFTIPATQRSGDTRFNPLRGMLVVLGRPIIWVQAIIIICAYCGYKGLDNFGLYAQQVLGMDELESASLVNFGAWTRPLAAVLAGLIADRIGATRSILFAFFVLAATMFLWSLTAPVGIGVSIAYVNFFMTFVFVYALRGIYFALLEETATPKHLTGTAVGLISLVGFSPDIFFAPIGARILDANPGLLGFQYYFVFLSSIMVAGLLAVCTMAYLRRRGRLWESALPGSK